MHYFSPVTADSALHNFAVKHIHRYKKFDNKLPKRARIAHLRPNVPAIKGMLLQSKYQSSLLNILYLSYLSTSFIKKDWIKITQATLRTNSILACRASNSTVILPEFELVRDFMPVQDICNFHKDPMKTKQAMIWTRWNTGFLGTKGQVTPKSIVQSGWNSNSSEILCLSVLSKSFIKFQLKYSGLYSGQGQI